MEAVLKSKICDRICFTN